MKNFKTYFLLFFTSLLFISCTTETFDEVRLLRQVVEIANDGTSMTTALTYNGNEIVSTDNAVKHADFTYTNSLITKIVILDKVASHASTLLYSYVDGNLVKITSSDNFVINYNYSNAGLISYEKWSKNNNDESIKVNYGTLTYEVSNLVEDEMTIDSNDSNMVLTNTRNFTYDSKKNALSNIVGFNALLNYNSLVSESNVLLNVETSAVTYKDKDEATVSKNLYKNEYKYDEKGYPVEITGEKSFFGDMANHVKTQLYY
jgi:hypothetical protein